MLTKFLVGVGGLALITIGGFYFFNDVETYEAGSAGSSVGTCSSCASIKSAATPASCCDVSASTLLSTASCCSELESSNETLVVMPRVSE